MIKQELSLKQQQKLSPLQIQTIKIIELPILELEQRIKKELEENPVLDDSPQESRDADSEEEAKDISLSELDEDDPIPAYRLRVNNWGKDERPQYNTFSVKQSFTQSLIEQLGFKNLDQHRHDVAAFIIGSLDDDGYLRRPIDSLVDDMAFRANIETTEEEVLGMLKVVQEFEPAGVGARDLQECLLLQLRALPRSEDVLLAEKILSDHFQDFSNRHFQRIMSRLGIDDETLKRVIGKIVKLNPAPGGQIDDSYSEQAQQIVPDFLLSYENGKFDLTMPRFSLPEIRVNKKYANMLMESAGSSEKARKEAAALV